MKPRLSPIRAFLFSFTATSFILIGGHAAFVDDLQIGPINVPTI